MGDGAIGFQRCRAEKSMGYIHQQQQREQQQREREQRELVTKQQGENDESGNDDEESKAITRTSQHQPTETEAAEEINKNENEYTGQEQFGASDELGATKRQIGGAAFAGGMAGAVVGTGFAGFMVGGPVVATVAAAGAAYAAATKENEVGEVARSAGDLLADKSENFLSKHDKMRSSVEKCSQTLNSSIQKASDVRSSISQSAKDYSNKASQKAKESARRCSLRASQVKDKASLVKDKVSTSFRKIPGCRRKRTGSSDGSNADDADETEFYDCEEDSNYLDDFEKNDKKEEEEDHNLFKDAIQEEE